MSKHRGVECCNGYFNSGNYFPQLPTFVGERVCKKFHGPRFRDLNDAARHARVIPVTQMSRQQPEHGGSHDGRHLVGNAQLGDGVLDVEIDGIHRDDQDVRDFTRGLSIG